MRAGEAEGEKRALASLKLARRQIDKETDFPINSYASAEYEVGKNLDKASFPKHGPYLTND